METLSPLRTQSAANDVRTLIFLLHVKHQSAAPPVEGSFVAPLFHLAFLYVRHRPGIGGGGPNGYTNILRSELAMKI